MKKERNWIARFLALAALIAAAIAIIVVAGSTHISSNSGRNAGQTQTQAETHKRPRTKAKTYTVESGDTLTSIAHRTGIPVAEIQALNPEVDPQTLIAGEVLKLQK